jgi:hypothetical protein
VDPHLHGLRGDRERVDERVGDPLDQVPLQLGVAGGLLSIAAN